MGASKPETVFYNAIHKKLDKAPHGAPYYEKMYNPLRAGTPDAYYSGDRGELWIEYKYIPRIPRSAVVLPDLSPRQARWLNNRHREGRNVAVVVGCPEGGVIYREQEWLVPLTPEEFRAKLLPRSTIAEWISNNVGAAACLLPDGSSPPHEQSEPATK